jgi:hypothetical protein
MTRLPHSKQKHRHPSDSCKYTELAHRGTCVTSVGRYFLVEFASVSILLTCEYANAFADFSPVLGFGRFLVFASSMNVVQPHGRQYSQPKRMHNLAVYFSPES